MKKTKDKNETIYGKFFSTNVELDENEEGLLVIKFPPEIAKYLDIGPDNKKVCWIILNGVLQLSSNNQPHLTIPMMPVIEDEFISYQ